MNTKHTPAETAFLLVALLRGMLSANRSRMDRHRAQLVGDELSNNLAAMASASTSSHEFVSKLIARFSWLPIHETSGHPVCAFLSESEAAQLDIRGHQIESGSVMVPWTEITAQLDLATVRAILRTASPFIGAAVAGREAPIELFDGISIEPPGQVPPRAAHVRHRITTARYVAFCVAVSPIAHGDFGERRGNTSPMRREDRYDLATGTPSAIPFLSAASIRGQLRRAAVEEMLAVLELDKTEVHPPLMNALISGGGLDAGATPPGIPVERRRKLRAFMPLIDAFGGTFDGQLMEGKLLVGDMLPLVRETAALVSTHLTGESIETLPSAETITVTRAATRKPDAELDVDRDDRMIFTTEAIASGVTLFCHVAIRGDGVSCPEMTGSAIAWALQSFQKRGTVGAKTASGFGQVDWSAFRGLGGLGMAESHDLKAFGDYLVDHKDELVAYLRTGKMPGEEDGQAEVLARTAKPKRTSKPKKESAE